MALTPYIETKLLIHSDTTDGSTLFFDSSIFGHQVNPINTAHETDEAKFGQSSIYFDGVADSLSIPDSLDWDLGTGDFTIDFWFMPASLPSNFFFINGLEDGDFFFGGRTTKIGIGRVGEAWDQEYTSGFVLYTWHHVAYVRNLGLLTIYVDGVSIGSATNGNTYNAAGLNLGLQSPYYLPGYIDELRVVKGEAIWTANFTPPTEAYVLDVAPASVSGTITEGGAPVARTVRAYNRATGELISETVSTASDGAYSLVTTAVTEVFVVAFDDVAGTDYNAVILDKITPT